MSLESPNFPSWPPLESNPEAFTILARKLGLKQGYEFTDIFGLEPELLMMIPDPVAAVILLFPTQSEKIEGYRKYQLEATGAQNLNQNDNGSKSDLSETLISPFYTHQYVGNACGTFALCHSLFNRLDLLDESSSLRKFVEDTQSLDPHHRGLIFADTTSGRVDSKTGKIIEHPVFAAHVDVATNESLNQTDTMSEDADVSEHFTTYINIEESGSEISSMSSDSESNTSKKSIHKVLELDGRLKKIVIHDVSNIEGTRFVEKVAGIVKKQFFELDPEQTNFSLMALCKTD